MKKINICLIQMSAHSSPEKNEEKIVSLIGQAAEGGGQIICLQELCNTLYFCREMNAEYFKLARSIPGTFTDRLCELAKIHDCVILAPVFEKEAPGIYYNSMAVIDAGGTLMGTYRKMHIPDDPGFYEKYYFTPGDSGYMVFDTKYAKIGALICWDQWFPEAARITAMKGAELLVYPTAIATLADETTEDKQEFYDAWKTVQRSHAIANGCFVASINRTGNESGSEFWGGSFIAGPFGQILAEGGDNEEIITAEIDLSKIEKQRQVWPFFRDRRIESYEPILKRFWKE